MYITSAETPATTELKICASKLPRNIYLDTKKKIRSATSILQDLGDAKFAVESIGQHSLPEAIHAAQSAEAFGTKAVTYKHQNTTLFASLAERSFHHSKKTESIVLCSAPESIRGLQVRTNTERRQFQGSVLFAERCTQSTATSLRHVLDSVAQSWQPETAEEVWNLSVEECPEYFAEGILTHNCGFPETNRWDEVDSLAGAFNRIQERAVANPDSIIAMSSKSRIGDKYGQGMGGGFDMPSFFDGMNLRKTHPVINFARHRN